MTRGPSKAALQGGLALALGLAVLGAVSRDALAEDGPPMLEDKALSAVYAQGVSTPSEFAFAGSARGVNLTGDGKVRIGEALDAGAGGSRIDTRIGQVVMSGSAQNGLSALININAANAPVQVLLNLNITIDSEIVNLRQGNLGSLAGLR